MRNTNVENETYTGTACPNCDDMLGSYEIEGIHQLYCSNCGYKEQRVIINNENNKRKM